MRNLEVKKFSTIGLFLIGVIFIFTFYSVGDGNLPLQENKNVAITVIHPSLPNVDFSVPIEYLGPQFLELSKKNRMGGDQKRFLVQFYFPSLKPNTLENAHRKETEQLMYASISTGPSGWLRRHVVGEEMGKIRTSTFVETDKYVCGFREARNDKFPRPDPKYISSEKLRERLRRAVERYAYYYQNPDNSEGDLYFNCKGKAVNGIKRCRVYMNSGFVLSGKTNISIRTEGFPRKYMCDFREIGPKIGQFINGFIMKKGGVKDG